MKVPLSWLNEFLNLETPVEKIAEALTLAGIEVEKIETVSPPFEGVVVATVRSTQPHPNADKLRIATVFDGHEELQIVCGAPNCRPGMKTALAKIGATLTDASGKSFKIKKAKMRDVESFGMLCGADELGLAEARDGIMELSEELTEGTDLASLYSDTILEVGLTPNLGHCMSILGIARELSAILSLPLKYPSIQVKEAAGPSIQELVTLRVEDKELCPLYSCRIVQNITVGPSPEWMKKRLTAAGMRSINNLVDIGNLVMLEFGLPLHIFDYAKIAGQEVIVSSNAPYPCIQTLDGATRDVPPRALLICDREKPIAIAGIMGSESSAVSDATRNVLIEAAHFDASSIRRTCKLTGLRSEASQRFEKGIDSVGVLKALERATHLLQECAGGTPAKGILIEQAGSFVPHEISLRIPRVNALLGTHLSQNEIISLLQRLEIKIKSATPDTIVCTIPSYRNDLKIEIDLIEEVARLYGFNNIAQHPPKYVSSPIGHAPIYLFEQEVRSYLMELGLQECLTCDLISPKLAELTGENQQAFISVLYPTSVEQSILRISLLPGLLNVIKYNQDHHNANFSGFEIGRIHFKNNDQFIEQTSAGIILMGKEAPHHWGDKPHNIDFYTIKGKVEDLLTLIGISRATFEESHLHNFHPLRQARIKVGNVYIGALGEIHPAHLSILGITERVYFAELNLHEMFPFKRTERKFRDIPSYPGSERDWTLCLTESTPIALIEQAIQDAAPSFLERHHLLDIYRSPQLGQDKKNVTFRFIYRDLKKTISLETVESAHTKLTQEVAKKLANHIF